ncbi:hypothetical protein LOZ58_002605 [Ophidiomyces ophidiicola]|nr:hypothetical protein LOZ65_001893 [Ophidiomyces ophidiicola]KAI1962981.1 hypothetical protein LOZ58_002605 [Ophidiomyces ophidiicola]
MSSSTRNLFIKVKRLVPPMLEKFHKGRVAVIGGSIDSTFKRYHTPRFSPEAPRVAYAPNTHFKLKICYTGAPYFSAMASAKLGCDMSHVICEPSAATVIKSYSPNLMVHPILQSTNSVPNTLTKRDPRYHAEPIISFLSRVHVLVIGPGLGRDPLTQKITMEVIKEARAKGIPMVLDADALVIVQTYPALVRGNEQCILTPNVVEFKRLARALGVDVSMLDTRSEDREEKNRRKNKSEACEKLSNALGGVIIIQKGVHDIISNGVLSLISDSQGGKKRCGGQGDTLTGALGTFLAWRKAYHECLWDIGEMAPLNQEIAETRANIEAELYDEFSKEQERKMSPTTTLLLAAWAGSAITRECSRRAFIAKGRSMQASDLTEEVHGAFLDLIGEPETSKL